MHGMLSVFQSLLKTGFPFKSVGGLVYLVSTPSEQLQKCPSALNKARDLIHEEIL
jgi:hypothetical protein